VITNNTQLPHAPEQVPNPMPWCDEQYEMDTHLNRSMPLEMIPMPQFLDEPSFRTCLCEYNKALAAYWGIDCRVYNQVYYYHPDYVGSVEFITDLSGRVHQFYHYAPFGEVVSAANGVGKDPYLNSCGEPIYTMNEFIQANKGLTRNEIINQRKDRSNTFFDSQPGGAYMRYVVNPHDGRVLDMRQVLIIGYLQIKVGFFVEVFQWTTRQASNMDSQDFYSNGLGYQFYMQSSDLQRLIAPTIFSDQLNIFFYKPKVIYN
jgi:hypothetical protein